MEKRFEFCSSANNLFILIKKDIEAANIFGKCIKFELYLNMLVFYIVKGIIELY